MEHLSLAFLCVVLVGLFHASLQRDCFTSQCHHDNVFDECVSGTWNCHADEFCEVMTTHILHNPILVMKCKNNAELANCQALSANLNMTDACSVQQLVEECVWCCENEDCVRGLDDSVMP